MSQVATIEAILRYSNAIVGSSLIGKGCPVDLIGKILAFIFKFETPVFDRLHVLFQTFVIF